MKENHIRRSRLLDKITVDSECAQEHFEELMNRVCRENIAIIVRDSKGSVVLALYWWDHLCLGLDPKRMMKSLVDESSDVETVEVLKYFVVANGYIQ